MRHTLLSFLFILLIPAGAAVADKLAPAAPANDAETGFLVAAPDRGFLGNEEIRDRYEAFAEKHNATLLFVTDARTRRSAEEALAGLARRGAKKAVVLPLFMSEAEARFGVLKAALEGSRPLPLTWARSFGASYFASEALADRLRALPESKGQRLVLAGYGAQDAAGAERMAGELRRLGWHAAAGLGFAGVEAVVWPEYGVKDEEALRAAAQVKLKDQAGALVVPAHLGKKLDSMMAFSVGLKRTVPAGSRLLPEEPLSELALTWMRREANRHLPWDAARVGVIVAAHGSDWHWNETMREGARALEARHPVEYAFSMADPPIIERAVRRLEARGARAIVIVRVFGLADSFERDIARMTGRDLEDTVPRFDRGAAEHEHGDETHGDHDDGHGDHGHGGPQPRIRSGAVLLTAGGLDDHEFFAAALLKRAQALSRDARRETVILTAHGTKEDARNEHWLKVLESLAAKMRTGDGARFREIRVATWREDWPDKRGPWVERVRGWVEEVSRGGTAIVIPARTTGTGPEAKLLAGLDYRLGSGFAPDPLFGHWLDEQVKTALAGRTLETRAVAQGPRGAGHSH